MANGKKTGRITLRVSADLLRALKREARRDRRTVSAKAVEYIEEGLAKEGGEFHAETRRRGEGR